MTWDDFIDFLIKAFGTAGAAVVLWLLIKLLGPQFGGLLVALFAKFGIEIAASTGMFFAALIVVALVILALWLDSGKLSASGGCTLTTYWFKPDTCTTTTCSSKCIAVTGPYPKWAGRFTFGRQATGCICPSSPFVTFGPLIQKLFEGAANSKEILDLKAKLADLAMDDIQNPALERLAEIIKKRQHGEDLTQEDKDFLSGLLKH